MPPKNLLLVSFDTMRFDAPSAAPDRRLLGADAALADTPMLDRIAGEGTFFTRAVTTCPYTSTSHASIFTGTYWPKHGVLDLFGYPMSAEVKPLAEAMQEQGWATAQNAGRDRSDGDMFAMDEVGLNRGYDQEAFGGWMRRKSLRWLRDVSGRRPWYFFFHTMAVHRPYGKSHRTFRALVRKDLAEGTPFRRVLQLYLRNVSRVDREFAALWRQLEAYGALEDTLVVIMSDHGEGLSVHGTIHCNPGGWQESVCRVPILFWCPGYVRAAQVIDAPISTVDVAATIADLMGLDWSQPLGFDGRSAADVVRGRASADSLAGRDNFFFASMSAGPDTPPLMQGLVSAGTKYVSFAQVTPQQWEELRRNCHKAAGHRKKQSRHYNMSQILARHDRGELELLFDVREDPFEQHNLAELRPEELLRFRTRMQQWYEQQPHSRHRGADMSEAEARDVQRRLEHLGYLD